ncbi:MAG: hypothetical protein AAGG01_24160, partial [Planctomycetota bacterium]
GAAAPAAGAAAAGMRCVILETGMAHVGGSTPGSAAEKASLHTSTQESGGPAVRSIDAFQEVPHAIGI